MILPVLLDENVSLRLKPALESRGHNVKAVALHSDRGASDTAVFDWAHHPRSLLITRDAHFTNPLRFPPAGLAGILYIAHGNLCAEDEVTLVTHFLDTHPPDTFSGKLVFLSPFQVRIR